MTAAWPSGDGMCNWGMTHDRVGQTFFGMALCFFVILYEVYLLSNMMAFLQLLYYYYFLYYRFLWCSMKTFLNICSNIFHLTPNLGSSAVLTVFGLWEDTQSYYRCPPSSWVGTWLEKTSMNIGQMNQNQWTLDRWIRIQQPESTPPVTCCVDRPPPRGAEVCQRSLHIQYNYFGSFQE